MIKHYSELQKSRVDLSEVVPLEVPFTIFIEPTSVCNFRCSYCPVSKRGFYDLYGKSFLQKADFVRICHEIKAIGKIKTLNLYMIGEPFLNKNIIEFIKIAKQLDIADRIIVTTNGSRLSTIDYDDLIESGLDYLRVSIYGGYEHNQKRRTNSNVTLNEIKESLYKLKETKKQRNSIHLCKND